jgi:hypothetical protein
MMKLVEQRSVSNEKVIDLSLVRANHEQACRAELHLAMLWLHQLHRPRWRRKHLRFTSVSHVRFLPIQVHVNWVIGSSHNARDLPQALSNAHPSSLSGQQLDREHEWSGANGCECIHTGIVALHPPASLSVVKPQHPSRAKAITQPLALLRHTVASGQRETLAGFGTLGTRAFTAAVVL